ncbi:2-hydroxyacyl-CoA dehydratase [bacterium]|nr:2-hydroxyacyl-CoA dehydratase [bacterium]
MVRFPPGTKIGLTTSVPIEIIFAAGCIPVDLNNVFICAEQPEQYVIAAEEAGYPNNVCGWIKGMYGVCLSRPDIHAVVSVVRGDCSNAVALMETLNYLGREVIPFAYPYDRDRISLEREMHKFMDIFQTSPDQVRAVQQRLNRIRRKLEQLDELTWQTTCVTGKENHEFMVNSSDFRGNPDLFEAELDAFLEERRHSRDHDRAATGLTRLGYIGVPPIITDLYDILAQRQCAVVFNEVQRQFSMPSARDDLVEQYLNFTYPYDIFGRIADIRQAIQTRHIQGIIHYVQSFCFRQIEDIIVRQELDVPVLTLEGERPARMDARTRIRLETFIEMLKSR